MESGVTVTATTAFTPDCSGLEMFAGQTIVLPLHQGSNSHNFNTNSAKKGGVAAKPMPSDFVAKG